MDNLEVFSPLRIRTLDGHRSIAVLQGLTARELVERYIEPELQELVVVLNNGTEIKDIDNFKTQNGDNLLIAIVAHGGKGFLGALMSIAVAAFAWYVTPMFFGMAAGSGLAGLGLAGALVSAGISMVGNMLISALIPPPSIGNTKSSDGTGNAVISGQSNQMAVYQPVIKVYGRHKVFPPLAANPIVTNVGMSSQIDAIYDFGYGNCELTDIKIGDTPAEQYAPSLVTHTDSLVTNPQYVTRKVGYDQYQYVLNQNSTITISTKPNAVGAQVSIQFPQGLTRIGRKGGNNAIGCTLGAWYRKIGTATWYAITSWQGVQSAALQQSGGSAEIPAVVNAYSKNYEVRKSVPAGSYSGGVIYISGRGFNTYIIRTTTGYGFQQNTTYQYFIVMAAYLIKGNPAYAGDWGANFVRVETPYVPPYYNGVVQVVNNTNKPFTLMGSVDFSAVGDYEIRVTRYSAVDDDVDMLDSTTLTLLRTTQQGSVVKLKKRHTMLEMRVIASEKLSGVVQNLSAIATSVLRTTANGITFVKKATSNPAWIALDILTGEANPRPLKDSQIDWASWIALANYCDEPYTVVVNGVSVTRPRYSANFIVDYNTTVQELIQSVLSSARATITTTTAGKYGVITDKLQATPRQLISPSNSWGFGGTRSFADTPHALKVSYIEPNANWQRTEIIVYWDGYNINNATEFDTLATFGVTNYSDAWRYGRYMMAQGISRSELFSISMDIENLVVQRGDLVYVAHDVPMIGGQAGRIISITGLNVTMDLHLSVSPNSYTFRMADGSIRSGAITAAIEDDTFTFDSVAGLMPDDLGVIGMSTTVTSPYLVQQITPAADLTAELLLVAYVEGVYDADQSPLPDWNPNFSEDIINTSDLEVYDLVGSVTQFYEDRYPFARVTLDWIIAGSFYDHALVYLKNGELNEELLGEPTETDFIFDINLRSDYGKSGNLTFLVVPVNATGKQGKSASINLIVEQDNTPPLAPPLFDLDLKRESITLSWAHPDEQDIDYYEIRYDPAITNGSYANSSVVVASVAYPIRSFDCPARLGTYFIKTVDTSGNRSVDYAATFTPSENIWGLNVIKIIEDKTTGWKGAKTGFINTIENPQTGAYSYGFSAGFDTGNQSTGSLISSGSAASGYPQRSEYYYDALYDGGDIYLTRFTSKITSFAFNVGSTELDNNIDVWHEIRWAQTSGVMADWIPLASADPIGYGDSEFGEWRMFQVGDYIGRTFQFRLVTNYIGTALPPDTGIVILDAVIEVDMPDRVDGRYDVLATAGGYHVTFNPSFKERPALAITGDNIRQGDTYIITNQDKNGFDIEFKDVNDISVSRQFDWLAKGYGSQAIGLFNGLVKKGKRKGE